MDNSFQTSFIPKKPIIENGANVGIKSKNTTNIFMVVAVVIFVIVVVSFGGLYLYKSYLTQNKETLSASLLKMKGSFDKDTIAELELYDKRSGAAKEVLEKHTVMSPLFEAINELTLSSIQYTRFDHTTVNNVFSIKISGIARDYKSIALQADIFNKNKAKMFKDVIFSNLTKDKNNYVTFDLEFSVDPSILSYTSNISNTTKPTLDTTTTASAIPTTTTETTVNPTTTTNITDNKTPETTLPATNNIKQ